MRTEFRWISAATAGILFLPTCVFAHYALTDPLAFAAFLLSSIICAGQIAITLRG